LNLKFLERFFNYLALLTEASIIITVYVGLIYFVVTGRTTVLAALFFALLSFFLFVLPALLSLRAPGSIGLLYLLLGSGGMWVMAGLPVKYLFVLSLLLFLAGVFLVLSLLARKAFEREVSGR